ncbi:cuticle protein 19-like [Daphnia pulicaria]|uniref:cuticle protein 19-like n=1 Tax=Daphnia pulicaria TaxID=35523 RepID=UPI001EECD42E|nr:cuticle protein 19-like [Daphnia pulicaria]
MQDAIPYKSSRNFSNGHQLFTQHKQTLNMQVFIFAILIAAVAANVAYPKPAYPAPAYPAAYPPKSYDYAPMPYNFAWAVKDDYTYNDYAHQETADDKGYVTGSYRVLLPDGRTQIVTYKADDYSGYVADVKYEGEAKYPEYNKPAYKAAAYPAPAYPAPAYPAPAYPAAYPSKY